MSWATCAECKKRCEVPFRPVKNKPVYCSDCFRKNDGSRNNFDLRSENRQSHSNDYSEQFSKINAKLDKILLVLQDLEIDIEDEESDSEESPEDNSESS